ncbi:MAG: hypothetical protein IJ660_03195 [Alphaproteobacteria bacterium]|nr:hypothetical protein [Alphaproteobacteria bacterium]
MTKKQTYLFLLAMGLLIIMAAHFMHISYVNHLVNSTWKWMQSPLVFGPAAICAFVFMNNKRYWMINIAAALIVSLVIQFFVVKGSLVVDAVLIRGFAFLVIVYLLNLIKVILDK